MADSAYRAGIVGLGFIGGADQVSGDALGQRVEDLDGTHADAFLNHARVNLSAGSSRDEGRRGRFEKRTGVKTYSDWAEMLKTESLDLVGVATYAPVHSEIVVACVKNGARAIFCEKPIATNMRDADRMLQACADAGVLLVINHNMRFHPNCRRLRDLVVDGGLGELTSASLQWGSGRLGNVGTHMIDAIQMLTGRPLEAVSGHLDLAGKPDCRGEAFRDPGGWGMLRLGGGLICTVDAADYAALPPSICVNGTEGRSRLSAKEVTVDYTDGRKEHWPVEDDGMSSMDRATGEIVEWLDSGDGFPYDPVEAVRTLEAIIGFHASHARNAAWTELPLSGTDRDLEVQSG
jgi:predicted dehydrogenase